MPTIHYKTCPVCNSHHISKVLTVKDFTVSQEYFDIWECDDCALRFTQDAPDEKEIGRYYQADSYVSHTDTREGLINQLYHLVRKRTLRQKRNLIQKITYSEDPCILDIGAGTGAFLKVMQKAGWDVTGVEPDETTRQRAWSINQIKLYDSKLLFQMEHESFDIITMWHVLEHVQDLHAYFRQIRKLLKFNGKLIVAVPNYTASDALHYKENWAAYDVPRHLFHFCPEAIQQLSRQYFFKMLAITPMWYDSFYISMLSEQYKNNGEKKLFSAAVQGLKSNLEAIKENEMGSSIIYILKK